jgi:hypothetical protein
VVDSVLVKDNIFLLRQLKYTVPIKVLYKKKESVFREISGQSGSLYIAPLYNNRISYYPKEQNEMIKPATLMH